MNLQERLLGFLIGADEAVNALGGGSYRKTISGTIGRGLQSGAWWAPAVRFVVDAVFGQGHCLRAAQEEAEVPE